MLPRNLNCLFRPQQAGLAAYPVDQYFALRPTLHGAQVGHLIWKKRRRSYHKNWAQRDTKTSPGRTDVISSQASCGTDTGIWITALWRWRPRWQHIDAASRKLRILISWRSFWRLLDEEDVIVFEKHIYSLYGVRRTAVTSSVQVRCCSRRSLEQHCSHGTSRPAS